MGGMKWKMGVSVRLEFCNSNICLTTCGDYFICDRVIDCLEAKWSISSVYAAASLGAVLSLSHLLHLISLGKRKTQQTWIVPHQCVLVCLFKPDFVEKLLPQTEHGNGFSPVCVLVCAVKRDFTVKLLSQTKQGKSFSPVCVLVCRIKLAFWE